MELSIVRRTMCSRVRTSSRVFEVMPVLGRPRAEDGESHHRGRSEKSEEQIPHS